jgi:hypothetical protein
MTAPARRSHLAATKTAVPRLNEVQRTALGYWWNLVTDAVQAGFTTTETTAIAADIAREMGGTVSFKESQAIATLYGYAKRMENASEAFQNAPPGSVITPAMIATPPWAREETEQRAYGLYHVKFNYSFVDQAGNQQTDIKTSVVSLQLPGSTDDISDYVNDDAAAFAAKYGHQLISAQPFQILAV